MDKFIRVLLSAGIICLAGCEHGPMPETAQADWQTAPADYVCTAPQMTKAQSEAAWCNANTSYFSTYCYGTALIRNCTKRIKAGT